MPENHIRLVRAVVVWAITLLGPAAWPQEQTGGVTKHSTRGITEDLSGGASFTIEIGPNLPRYRFEVIPEVRETDQYGNAQSTVRDIEVYRGNSDKPLQHLTGCELGDMEAPRRGADWFRADDFNFDGYRDIYLMTGAGATGNQSGCVWLYNPATGGFDFSKEFTEVTASRHRIDSEARTILTFEREGMAGLAHTASRYKVENNLPVLIWSEWQDWDREKKQFHCVVEERRGSKMVTTLDKWGGTWGNGNDSAPCDPARLFE